jgi:5'(3')-deoxyribonucleotidase
MQALGHAYIPTSAKEKVAGDVFIDDKLKNVVNWQVAHPSGRAYLYDAPYNQNSGKLYWPRRFTWDRVGELL